MLLALSSLDSPQAPSPRAASTASSTLAVFFGISLIFRGVFALVAAFQLRKVHKEGGSDVAPPITAAPA